MPELLLDFSSPPPHPAWRLGVGTDHASDYVVDMVTPDRYVLLSFHTPFEALTGEGRLTGEAGDLMLVSPGFHQWHRGVAGQSFINDWIHVPAPEGDDWVEKYKIPVNRLFTVDSSGFVENILRQVMEEVMSQPLFFEDQVGAKVEELFRNLGRAHSQARALALSPVKVAHQRSFAALRLEIHQSCREPWSLEELAGRVHLSPSRFSALYREFFGISPMGDLIKARMAEARWCLAGGFTIAQAAARAGYTDINYFSRLFKVHNGRPPGAYLCKHRSPADEPVR